MSLLFHRYQPRYCHSIDSDEPMLIACHEAVQDVHVVKSGRADAPQHCSFASRAPLSWLRGNRRN
jgi:hypothetical protein